MRNFIALSLLLFVCTACNSEQKPPTIGETKDFATLCNKANDGKRVAAVGYLRLPKELNLKTGPVLELSPTNKFTGKLVGVSTKIGNQPNQVAYVPKQYTYKDLKVNLTNGKAAGFGTKVKVSGDLYFPVVAQKFQCALSNPLVELAK